MALIDREQPRSFHVDAFLSAGYWSTVGEVETNLVTTRGLPTGSSLTSIHYERILRLVRAVSYAKDGRVLFSGGGSFRLVALDTYPSSWQYPKTAPSGE